MRRLRLLLLRMHGLGRLLLHKGIYQETYTYEDERYAQPLAHVQDHILFESDLRFLDELYEESHSEKDNEEHPYKAKDP